MTALLIARHRASALVAAGAAAAILLSACSSSGGNTAGTTSSGSNSAGTSTTAGGGSSSAGGSDVVAKAQQMVAKFSAATTQYPVPSGKVNGVSALKGRTVYYIPLVQQIPTFVVAADSMRTALAKLGMKLQICNGQAQPSAIASCVQQAVSAKAAGIVTDAIPYGMAQNAFSAAKSKLPIVIGDQVPQAGTTNSNQVAYVPGVTDMPTQIAWWIIADSKGKADAIIGRETDNPSSTKWTDDSLSVYKSDCPDCKIQAKDITASTPALLASQVSANIGANPSATYYYAGFEDSLQATAQGIQQAGKSATMSLTEAAGTVNGLGMLKSGKLLKAVVVVDEAYEGWALVDQVVRMATKSGPVDETVPSRLFTASNIGSIKVTPAAQSSGEWFGDNSYKAGFAQAWGIG